MQVLFTVVFGVAVVVVVVVGGVDVVLVVCMTILTLSLTSPGFYMCLQNKSFENVVGKGEIAREEQFLLPIPSVLYPFRGLSAIIIKFKIVICKLFQFGSLKFAVCERVKIDIVKGCRRFKVKQRRVGSFLDPHI